MKKTLLFFLFIFLVMAGYAQESQKFGINFSGFVKNDFFYDTRQTISIREGHFLLYPASELLDKDGNDINGEPQFNFLSIQTRLKGKITGPDAFGAKTSGVIEGAFFGHSNSDINGFRLRHAYAKLTWPKTELLFGQYWHPMFVAECFPGVVSFNTGVPFQPFSRNPQIRLSRMMGNFKFFVAAMSQRDFQSTGPAGGSSSYLRNAQIPDLHAQMQYAKKNENGKELVAGIGGGYKRLRPVLVSDSNYVNKNVVEGFSGIAFIKYVMPKLTIKVEGVWGQNLTDLIMLGGYAPMNPDTSNVTMIEQGIKEYTTIDNFSLWTDIHTNGKKFQAGLFAGYTKNLGSLENLEDWKNSSMYYARGGNIDYVYRVSPRFVFNSGKARFSTEFEYTTAAYGTYANNNSLGEVQDAKDISNLRVLFAVYYFF